MTSRFPDREFMTSVCFLHFEELERIRTGFVSNFARSIRQRVKVFLPAEEIVYICMKEAVLEGREFLRRTDSLSSDSSSQDALTAMRSVLSFLTRVALLYSDALV